MKATMITPKSQFVWMQEAGLISGFRIVEHLPQHKYSMQWPKDSGGYLLVRAEINIPDPDGNWQREYLKPRFHPGDPGYEEQGYHNEFCVLPEVPEPEKPKLKSRYDLALESLEKKRLSA